MSDATTRLCHVTTHAILAEARGGVLTDAPFLHCCTEEQLPFVLARHFPGIPGLMVVRFDPAAIQGRLEWERSEPGMEPFPHIYGALPLAGTEVTPA